MKIDPNAPAYPRAGNEFDHAQDGLTIRQEFAARAMQGMLASPECCSISAAVAGAVVAADALIAALNQEGQ